uniref:Uncharacterized protein n=1 Tax=Meloidogyne enterolobii TaxID=390850 RepID=A0A6V7VK03_MELEN|nr:unnamed protein product [Meloidogyne enterolobii]
MYIVLIFNRKCENGRLIKDTEEQIGANTDRLDKHDEEMADMKKKLSDEIDERVKRDKEIAELRALLNKLDKKDEEGRKKLEDRINVMEANMTEMRIDINMLKNWKEDIETEKLQARLQAEEDKSGDDGCSTEESKRKKRAAKNQRIKNLVEKGKSMISANQPFLEDPEKFLKKKGVGYAKKAAKKVIGGLETACVVKTAGLGAPLCSLAGEGLEWVADKGITELCKLAGEGIKLVKEGVGKAVDWVADGVKSILPW